MAVPIEFSTLIIPKAELESSLEGGVDAYELCYVPRGRAKDIEAHGALIQAIEASFLALLHGRKTTL